jgi:hypothetical protein
MLKHYNEEKVKTMAKTPEEAEKRSNDTKSTDTQKTQINEGPRTRSKIRELAKQNQPQKLYSNLVKHGVRNNFALQTSVHNQNKSAQKFGAPNINVQGKKMGAQKFDVHIIVSQNSSNLACNINAHKPSVQGQIKSCTD